MSSSPSSSSIRHPHHPDLASRVAPQGALPVTLNCCHDSQTGSAESEDWSWYKRHSVSVMDHRRITALREKGFTDNRDQLAVGIYDVPPKQERRIDDNSWDNLDEPNYSYPRPDPETLCTASSSSTSICSTPTSNSAVLSCGQYGNYKRIVPAEREYANSDSSEQRQAAIYKWQSASTELLDAKVSNLDEMLAGNGQKDSSCKNSLAESLRHLKKQESDLQMEMVLLDEILQNCSVTSLFSDENSHSETHGAVKQHLSELVPDQKFKDISSEPVMSEHSPDFKIISGNISSLQPAKSDLVHSSNFRKLDRTAVLKLNTSMPEGTPVSSLFYAKFNNIPPTSPLNAPLPYVNLSRYDDESYSHVHLPGSADSAPVVRMPSMQVLHDGQNHGLHHRNFSLSSLQTPTSTSNLVDVDYQAPGRNQMPQHRMINRAALLNSSSSTQVHQWEQTDASKHDEILVVKMNNLPEYTDHKVYKSRQPLLQNYVGISHKVHSDIVNILTTDAQQQDENDFCARDIYENLPLRNDSSLPPELPPKGPALLKRLNNSNKCSESEKTSQLMRYQHSQDVRKDADSRKYRADGHAHHMLSDKELQASTDTREDNYLIMGSPKIKHKELTLKPNASFDTSFSAHRNHCENAGAVKNELYGRDVMCVGKLDCSHDDEIYLDMESNQEVCHKDLYICEADLKLSPVPDVRMLGESTYMEMANVASKKSLLVKQVATPQRLMVNMAHSEENAYFINSPLSHVPPPPPRPLSLKIRHNSDSGVPPKSHEFSSPDEHKDNRPKDKPIKSPTRVYTKIKKTSQQGQVAEPPMPFPNLIDFSKKMADSRSTYVNTCLDVDKNLVPQEVFISRDVPLPEPVKEGFLARFKRRSSRDKNAAQANEKYANIKIRNSVLERSMSEHDSSKATKEEKSSRLKVGRRRSSSFPNQLSYQESLDTASDSMLKQAASSSSSFSSASSRPKPDQSESPSFRDFSDDSDLSPLLKRGNKSIDQQQLTVLHVRRSDQYPVSTYIQACKSPIKINQLYADSSKTDDEKLIEIIQQSKKPVIYQRSSSLELKKPSQEHEQGCYLKLPVTLHRKERRSSFEKATGYSSSVDSDIPYNSETTRSVNNETSPCSDQSKVSCLSSLMFSLDKEHAPPALPPKTRPYQGPLSPVIEIAPLMPVQTEPIYVEMDKFVSSTDVGASREKAHTANQNRPAEEDKDCHPISKVETKAGIFTF